MPRYSLRTLMIVVTVAAVPMGWAGYSLNWVRQRQAFRKTYSLYEVNNPFLDPPKVPWSLRLFGAKSTHGWYRYDGKIATAELQRAERLFPEALVFYDPPATH